MRRARSDVDGVAPRSKTARRTIDEAAPLDPELAAVLRTGREAFVASPPTDGGEAPVREVQLSAALALAKKNKDLRILGVDSTAPLSASTARALGEFGVSSLKLVGLRFDGAAAAAAFAEAAAANATLVHLAIFQTNADGDWAEFDPAHSELRRKILALRHGPLLTIEQVGGAVGAGEERDEAKEEEEEEAEEEAAEEEEEEEDDDDDEEEEEEEEDCVECDGRRGSGRKAVVCGRQLKGQDLVFTSSFLGRDYCADCHARLGRDDLRQTTAELRIREVT